MIFMAFGVARIVSGVEYSWTMFHDSDFSPEKIMLTPKSYSPQKLCRRYMRGQAALDDG